MPQQVNNAASAGSGNRSAAGLAVAIILWIAVAISALAIIYSTHLSRQFFGELQNLKTQRNDLEVEWGQLLLEQSTWTAQFRIERLAIEQLGMVSPHLARVIMVQP